jgi:prepilin-type processing-associated H-X9-DG protein
VWSDRDNADNSYAFGSAHLNGFNMCFCDGSIHMIPYTIDRTVHNNLCNRNDGAIIPPLP